MSNRSLRQERGLGQIGLNLEEAAAVLGIDSETVGRLARAGVLPHIKVGGQNGRTVIGRCALEEWLTQECWKNAQVPLGGQNAAPTLPVPGHAPRRRRD